ncbi:MAG: DnaA/Hda family protein [Desulfovibrionaceae bacterium]|nr:DnaA/Hda family protein [Desulfovibrionaceae bacterium]
MSDCWNQILTSLSTTVPPADYKVWLAPLSAEISGHTLTLSMNGASDYMARRLERKLGQTILAAASEQMNCRPEEITLRVSHVQAAGKAIPDQPAGPAPQARPQRPEGAQAVSARPQGLLSGPEAAAPVKKAHTRPAQTAEPRQAQPAQAQPSADPHMGPDARGNQWTMAPQALIKSMPLNQGVTISGDAAMRKQWRYCFDDFVVGPTNLMAMSAAQDVCRPKSYVETLFVSSEPGLGKTHIVQSAVRQILEDRGSNAKVAYLTGDEFYARFRMGLVNDNLEDFMGRVRALDFLLMDDLQSLRGKAKTQEVLLSLVKHLQDRGSRVVFSSRFDAKDLKALDSQLVSLVSSGVQASMQAPDYQMRCEILRRKAKAQQTVLPEEVVAMLAKGIEGDVRQLESCLQTLLLKTRVMNTPVTPEAALEVLSQFAPVKKEKNGLVPTLDGLLGCVSREYNLTERQICSCLRRRNFVEARNVLFYLARKYTNLTLVQIGARVNKRHSTVIKGIATVEQSMTSETASGRQTARVVHLIEKTAGCVTG